MTPWVLALVALALGQQVDPPLQDPILRLKVQQVVVPVSVLDKSGRPVKGLKATDFEVTEEGVRQTIVALTENGDSSVALPSSRVGGPRETSPGVSQVEQSAPEQSRTYVICFDQLHATPEGFYRARTALDRFLRDNLQGSPRVALVNLSTRIQVVQTATTDLNLVRRTVSARNFAMTSAGPERLDFAAALNQLKERMEQYCSSCPCGRVPADDVRDCKIRQEQIRQDIDTKSGHFDAFGRAFVNGLDVLLKEQGKLGGMATFVFISEGFTLQPGKELYAIASAYLPDNARFAFQPPFDLQSKLEGVMKSALQSNIVIETIDVRGVHTPSFLAGGLQDASSPQMGRSAGTNRGGTLFAQMDSKWSSVAFDSASVLAQMADTTSGEFHHNSNDLGKAFRDAFSHGRENYLLSYQPAHPLDDDRFYAIRVRVSAKGASTIRAKKGYWATANQAP